MRLRAAGPGSLLGPTASLLWLLAVAGPTAMVAAPASLPHWLAGTSSGVAGPVIRDRGTLLLAGFAWSIGVGLLASLLGWLPGRRLRAAAPGAGRTALALALTAPVALPSYLLAWCWWQAVPPGSWIGDWAIRHDLVGLLRGTCLAVGLLCWGWPIAAWAVAALSRRSEEVAQAAALDGAGRLARVRLAWSEDRWGLALGAVGVALMVFGNTTAFDLAQIRSFGFELRTLDARGAGGLELLRAAWPALAVAMLGGAAIWTLTGPQGTDDGEVRATPSAGVGWAPWLLVAISIGVPLGLMLGRLDPVGAWSTFVRLHGRALTNTIIGSAIVGALAATVAAGLTLRLLSPSPMARRWAGVEGLGWCAVAAFPATAIVAASVLTYNRPALAVLYDSPAVAILGQLTLVGAIAAIAARYAAAGVPTDRLDALALDGGCSQAARARAARPAVIAAAGTAFGVAAALSLGEVVVGARLMPPAVPVLATSILNAVHYQDPETVMLATIVQLVAAVLVAGLALVLWSGASGRMVQSRGATRNVLPVVLLFLTILGAGGCEHTDGAGSGENVPVERTFGNRGDGPGSFDGPRAIAVDERGGHVYVIDKTARVQRFGLDGRFELEWTMPEFQVGKPTGVTVGPDGTVWVADTHYHRVIAYDSEGRERLRFGRYGTGPGEFIYPTDVAIAPDGEIYVSEYGGNDRIQVFSPEGAWRFAFGGHGERAGPEGVEFRRPQAMVFDARGEELYVADSCNHRIVVVDRRGRFLRTFGVAGSGVGEFAYPYGIDRLPDGSLLVVEFGNQRMQRLTPEGRALAAWGTPGEGRGQLRAPWGVASTSGTIFLLDSGNARVQMAPIPEPSQIQ